MAGRLEIDVERDLPGPGALRAALSVPLDAAQVTVLFGPSAAGKTTLLRCIAGLDRAARGRIDCAGSVWLDSARSVFTAPQRRGVGYVFQEQVLFPHLSVAGNIGYGLRGGTRHERGSRVEEMAALVGLAGLERRRPDSLSGGQRQRVAIARALAGRPRLALLDEPFSALDTGAREQLRGDLRRVLKQSGTPAVLVTHDRTEAMALGDRVAVMVQGKVRQCGPVEEVFSSPADALVAEAVGIEAVLPATVDATREGVSEVLVAPGVRLAAVNPDGLSGAVFACIRATDVVLQKSAGGLESARNHLRGTVASVRAEHSLFVVAVDCGAVVKAVITRAARDELGLVEGVAVIAVVKATNVRLIPRQTA